MKTNKGFSLVELIVVIAIMAIIAAVAVPVYNVYIDKANKAADEQLISDIEKVLTYASYAGSFNGENDKGGYIIFSTNGITNEIVADSALDIALRDAFGADYRTSLKLSYDKWSNSGLADGLAGAMAMAVKNSSYMTGGRVDSLLDDVEKMTGMAQNLASTMFDNPAFEGTTLSSLYGADVLNATGKKYGIECDGWTASDWDTWGAKPENSTAYSNLLVLAAANDIENGKESGEFSAASGLIMNFSSYYAFAATNPEFSAVLDTKLEELQSVTTPSEGAAWYRGLETAANNAGYDKYKYEHDEEGNKVLDDEGNPILSDKYNTDGIAFGSLMAGLGNPSDEQAGVIAGDLNNEDFFTSGEGNAMYNDYLDAVDAIASIPGMDPETGISVPEGCIAIIYGCSDNAIILFNSLPTSNQ